MATLAVEMSPVKDALLRRSTRSLAVTLPSTLPCTMTFRASRFARTWPFGPMVRLCPFSEMEPSTAPSTYKSSLAELAAASIWVRFVLVSSIHLPCALISTWAMAPLRMQSGQAAVMGTSLASPTAPKRIQKYGSTANCFPHRSRALAVPNSLRLKGFSISELKLIARGTR